MVFLDGEPANRHFGAGFGIKFTAKMHHPVKKSRKKLAFGASAVALLVVSPLLLNATPATPEKIENPVVREQSSETDQIGFFNNDGVDFSDPVLSFYTRALLDPEATVNIRKILKLKRGDTLMNTLTKGGVERTEAYYAIEALSDVLNPRKIKAGQEIQVVFEKAVASKKAPAVLKTIILPMEFGQDLVVNADENARFSAGYQQLPTMSLKMFAEGTIHDSLYLAALDQGVPLGVVSEMIRLFSFDVDFQREIWSGDKFQIYFERRITSDGEAENTGKVLAASLVLHGRPLTFYRFEGADGKVDYYTADGKSARKMLMKTPIDGARLTSRYGSRKHPVLGYTKMHKGVDFGASTGTPIMAAGDGIVEKASPWGSYGNYLSIRHNGTYKTAYAHMSGYAKGIKAGVRVKQGQIIGYVGATGRVTGAHLHYEILKDGAQINPLTLKMPKGESLKSAEMSVFLEQIAGFDAERDQILALYRPISDGGSPGRAASPAD